MDASNAEKQQGPFAELKPFKVTHTENNGSARSKESTLVDSARDTSPHSQTAEAQHEPKAPSSIHSHDAEPEPEYPTSWRLALIVIGLCLSIFCMALVSILLRRKAIVLIVSGQHDSSDCNSQNHRPIPVTRRRGLVRQFLPPYNVLPYPGLWQAVHFLLHKVGVPDGARDLRDRFSSLWCGSQLSCADYRTGDSWSWGRRSLLRSHDHYISDCTAEMEAFSYRFYYLHVWNRQRSRAPDGWCVYRSCQLAMVFLYQPSHWRRDHLLHSAILQGTQISQEHPGAQG